MFILQAIVRNQVIYANHFRSVRYRVVSEQVKMLTIVIMLFYNGNCYYRWLVSPKESSPILALLCNFLLANDQYCHKRASEPIESSEPPHAHLRSLRLWFHPETAVHLLKNAVCWGHQVPRLTWWAGRVRGKALSRHVFKGPLWDRPQDTCRRLPRLGCCNTVAPHPGSPHLRLLYNSEYLLGACSK